MFHNLNQTVLVGIKCSWHAQIVAADDAPYYHGNTGWRVKSRQFDAAGLS